MGLLDDLKKGIERYENALARLNNGDYFRVGTMGNEEWDNDYGVIQKLSKPMGYLDEAKTTIRDATAKSVKANESWRGTFDSFGGHGFNRSLDKNEADPIAQYLLQVINDPNLEWLKSKSVLEWDAGARQAVISAIDRLQADAKRVADEISKAREQYYENGPALEGGMTAEQVLAEHVGKLKGNQLEDYLTSLISGQFYETGYELYDKLVMCAEKVFGTRDHWGRVVPRHALPFQKTNEQKVAERILSFNNSSSGRGGRPTRSQVNRERNANVRDLDNSLGLEAGAALRMIDRGERVSPRQLAAGALHVDNKIFNIMLTLKQRLPSNSHIRLEQAVMGGNEDSIQDVLFSSTWGDAEDSVRQAMEAVRLRQDAMVLADRTKAMKDQDYNLYMEFLYYYLGCSEDDGDALGVTPFWEQDSVINGKLNEVSSWYMSRQSGQGSGVGIAEHVRRAGGNSSLERAGEIVERTTSPYDRL